METAIEVLCDFDGTVTSEDTVDLLLERLADPAWRILEERWVRGEIDARECMAGQVALIRGGAAAIRRVLGEVQVEPTFAPFVTWCRRRGIRLRIVSGGIDLVIHDLLAREGVAVDEIWAPRLLEHQDGRLALEFPPSLGRSRCGSDFCKCSLFEPSASRPLRILIGDGRSDFCCAHWADRVFARSQLIAYCRAHAVEFLRFENFSGIRRTIERWARRPLAGVPVAAGSPVDA